jgi:hypothetical protein
VIVIIHCPPTCPNGHSLERGVKLITSRENYQEERYLFATTSDSDSVPYPWPEFKKPPPLKKNLKEKLAFEKKFGKIVDGSKKICIFS